MIPMRSQGIPEGTPKKSCNDDMILFIFHINASLTSDSYAPGVAFGLFREGI
jgi:hypothetical protein